MVINPNHSPIITEEDYEPSSGEVGGSEVGIVPRIVYAEEVVTSITTDPRRTVTYVTTNSGKANTPVTSDSTVVT